MRKRPQPRGQSIWHPFDGSSEAVIAIHGFGGSRTERYWGNIPKLMSYDVDFDGIDLFFWGYATSLLPFANILALPLRGRRIASLEEVARDLSSFILDIASEYDDARITLVGHSMGGIISILAVEQLLQQGRLDVIKSIHLLATPQSPPMLARIASRFLPGNPHLSFMADPRRMHETMKVSLDNLSSRDGTDSMRHSLFTSYTHYSLDEVIRLEEDLHFSRRYNCEAKHSWTSKNIEKASAPYQALKRALRDGLS